VDALLPGNVLPEQDEEPPTLRRTYRATAPPVRSAPDAVPVTGNLRKTSWGKRATLLLIVGTAAILATGFVRRMRGTREASPPPPAETLAPLADRPVTPIAKVEPSARAVTDLPVEKALLAPPDPRRVPLKGVVRSAGRERVAAPPPAATSTCTPPYTTDDEGIRHPKLECL